jgi:hypothetical protein
MVPPGLIDLRAGSPIELTASLAQGFDMGVVVLLDYVESLATFFTHESHQEYASPLPLVPSSHIAKNYFLRRPEAVFSMEGTLALINLRCNRVNDLYEQVCELDSTIGYDIEF